MYVIGLSTQRAPRLAAAPRPFESFQDESASPTSRSARRNPTLWRVRSYSGPGLPRPTTSLSATSGKGYLPSFLAGSFLGRSAGAPGFAVSLTSLPSSSFLPCVLDDSGSAAPAATAPSAPATA